MPRCIVSFFLLAAVAFTQTRPKVTAVVSGADFRPGVTLSGYATLFGTGLSDAEYKAQTLPYPQKLGNTQVHVCYWISVPPAQLPNIISFLGCVPTALVYVSPAQINFLIPPSLLMPKSGATGEVIFVVSVGNVIDQDASAGTLVRYWITDPYPRIFYVGTDCLIDPRYQNRSTVCGLTFESLPGMRAPRGAITDLQGNVINSSNPTKLGSYYSIWLTGMGTFQNGTPPAPVRMVITNIPVYGYPGDTWMSVNLDYVGASQQFPGLYQINFQLPPSIATSDPHWFGYPPPFPCGNYNWEVTITVSEGWSYPQSSNPVQIPIVVNVGDVPCSWEQSALRNFAPWSGESRFF